jgi:hypothetical protein
MHELTSAGRQSGSHVEPRYIHMQCSAGGAAALWKTARTVTIANSFANRLTHSVAAAKEALKHTTAARASRENIDFENTQAIEQRRRLRKAPDLLEALEMWWQTAKRSAGESGGSSFELGKAGYVAMSRKIQKVNLLIWLYAARDGDAHCLGT